MFRLEDQLEYLHWATQIHHSSSKLVKAGDNFWDEKLHVLVLFVHTLNFVLFLEYI
jgi:hypothetical protein